ncbi:MAG: transglutaminase domain-containing protein [Deltaproteobacteria bacterium]|nr:transglutaminase domain-containing protein [Deltaproteobacteria bacterium]
MTLSRNYKFAVAGVVAVWLVSMGALVWQDRSGPRSPGIPSGEAMGTVSGISPTGDEYMGAYLENERVGWVKTSSMRVGNGWTLNQESELKLTVQGQVRTIETVGTADTDRDFRLRAFSFRLTTEGSALSAYGKVEDDTLAVTVDLGEGKKEIRFPLKKDILVDLNVDRYLAAKGLKPGDRFEIEVFDPQTLGTVPVKVQVVGTERMTVMGFDVYATHLRRTLGGATFDAWIDANGKSLKEQGPLGLTLVREAPADARKVVSRPGRDLIAKASIAVNTAIPEPEARKSVTLKLHGVDLSPYQLASWRQKVSGDDLTISRDDLDALPKTSLPVTDPAFSEFLKPATLIESDNPEMARAAREALAGEGMLPAAALKLNEWLFAKLKKKNVVGVPDALTSLKSMEGDCNEHAFLYVAMARAAGIPARVAVGTAYLGGRFYYHAWPEVWAGGWIALDPTWGQAPADATHVRFIADDVSRFADIIGLIGNLKIEVISWD